MLPSDSRVSCRPLRIKALSLLLGLALIPLGSIRAQQSVIAVDLYNKKVHIESNANTKRPVGGLAKIATALVVLDWSDTTKVPLNVLATISPADLQVGGANELNLQPGDQVTLRDLIYASMMTGDAAAANALAEFVGNDVLMRRSKRGNPFAEFVSQMNKLAAREGCTHTRFTNAHGLDFGGSATYSSAADIARITLYALSRAPFRFYTNQKTREIGVIRGGQRQSMELRNTNALLGVGTIDGVKTGNSPQSGGCVVITEEHQGTVMKQADGKSAVFRHRMIVVVLGSADPFGEAQSLLRGGWATYEQWIQSGRPIADRKQLLPYF